jgi:hypothetical protein
LTSGALVNDGNIEVDVNFHDGGSSLTVAGALTNDSVLTIGNYYLSASDKVAAASLDNAGTLSLSRVAPRCRRLGRLRLRT